MSIPIIIMLIYKIYWINTYFWIIKKAIIFNINFNFNLYIIMSKSYTIFILNYCNLQT